VGKQERPKTSLSLLGARVRLNYKNPMLLSAKLMQSQRQAYSWPWPMSMVQKPHCPLDKQATILGCLHHQHYHSNSENDSYWYLCTLGIPLFPESQGMLALKASSSAVYSQEAERL
jgi:hypothetical protein